MHRDVQQTQNNLYGTTGPDFKQQGDSHAETPTHPISDIHESRLSSDKESVTSSCPSFLSHYTISSEVVSRGSLERAHHSMDSDSLRHDARQHTIKGSPFVPRLDVSADVLIMIPIICTFPHNPFISACWREPHRNRKVSHICLSDRCFSLAYRKWRTSLKAVMVKI